MSKKTGLYARSFLFMGKQRDIPRTTRYNEEFYHEPTRTLTNRDSNEIYYRYMRSINRGSGVFVRRLDADITIR